MIMISVFVILGFAGLLGAYDIARRMTWRTHNGMRAAVIVIGVGCALSMFGAYQGAALTFLIGCGLHRVFDKRVGGWTRDRTDPGNSGAAPAQPVERGQRHNEPMAGRGHGVGGGLHLAAVRQDPVRRSA